MAVTLKQVAERSGLSVQAVSQILNASGKSYREATREKVLRAAQELGYRPNSSARSIRTGRFGCVALIRSTDPSRSTLFRDVLEGIENALQEHDLHLVLARLPDRTLTDPNAVPKLLREWMADGLLLHYQQDIPLQMQALLEQHRLPSIWINSKHPSDCVYPNDFEAGRQATQHLLDLGHRRIAHAAIRTTHYSGPDRQKGYEAAMKATGLLPHVLTHEGGCAEGVPFWREVLARSDRPTAVVAYMPLIAQSAFFAALTLGMTVPNNLSLVTFHENLVDEVGLPITTWLIPDYATGWAAVEMLIQKIAAPFEPLAPQILPFGFDLGATCQPPGVEG